VQPACHPEALEKKQAQQSESPQVLSKMTKREQAARCDSMWRVPRFWKFCWGPHCPAVKRRKKAGARAWRPGPEMV